MSFGNRPIESITEADLQDLVQDQISEDRTLEFKQTLPGSSDSDKLEFLADVCAFANGSGGWIIYGIREEHGCASEVLGLDESDQDSVKLRYESIIRDGLAPRIPGLRVESVKLADGKFVLLIRIPHSFSRPHMVCFKKSSRFYVRGSAGKQQLDVNEIRMAFALSETLTERIKSFRQDRLGQIISGETPILMKVDTAKLVIHITPLTSFEQSVSYDINSLYDWGDLPVPMNSRNCGRRINFDGLLTYSAVGETGLSDSYVQVFRNGVIELVNSNMFNNEKREISGHYVETEIIKSLPGYIKILKKFEIQLPFFIMVSFLNVKGYQMFINNLGRFDDPPIDRNNLVIPEILVENYEVLLSDPTNAQSYGGSSPNPSQNDAAIARVLKPAFDCIWNAAGYAGSPRFPNSGH